MEHLWKDTLGNRSTQKKLCLAATSFTTNYKLSALGLNPGLHCEMHTIKRKFGSDEYGCGRYGFQVMYLARKTRDGM
jgi:hypothetical protein